MNIASKYSQALLLAIVLIPAVSAQEEEHQGEEHAAETGNEIHLTEVQRERLTITVSEAGSGSAASIIQAPATVRFNANQIARVGPLLESKVVEVTRDLGQTVRRGETIAILDSVELGRTKARYLTASARIDTAEAAYQRDETLARQQITSEAELLESRAAFLQAQAEHDALRAELKLYGLNDQEIDAIAADNEQPLSRYLLSTPISGTIQRRDLVPGQTLSSVETPIHVVNNETMWVMVEAFEQNLTDLKPGQTIELSVRALPGRSFSGTSDWISQELDEQSRTVRVRAVMSNSDGALRAGMFGTARILTESNEQYAMVPVDAVQTLGGDEQVIFVPAAEPGAFLAIPIQTGQENGGLIEVTSGILPGDRVVVRGAFDLMSALTAGSRSAEHAH